MVRGIIVGFLVFFVSIFFTQPKIHNIGIIFSFIFLTAVVFALGGLLNAIFAKKFDDISIVPTFILTPFTYLGGVFYSIKLLPEFWQTVSHFNPVLYMINAFRYGFLGVSDISLWTSYAIIIGFIIALFLINLRLISVGYGLRS